MHDDAVDALHPDECPRCGGMMRPDSGPDSEGDRACVLCAHVSYRSLAKSFDEADRLQASIDAKPGTKRYRGGRHVIA